MKKPFIIFIISFITFSLFASYEDDLININNQIAQKEARIRALEVELSRLLIEPESKNSEDDGFFFTEDNEISEASSTETEEDFFFEEVDPSIAGKIKNSIASQKAYENSMDDSRVAQGAQAVYDNYLAEQESQRLAMQELGSGLQTAAMGMQQVYMQSKAQDAKMAEMARQNRQQVAAAMNQYSNAYKQKMESSGYNDWKKSVAAQASGQYYQPSSSGNRSTSYKSNSYSSGNNSSNSYTSQSYSSSNSSSSKKWNQSRNWWVMSEISADSNGTAKSSRYYIIQSNTRPSSRKTRSSIIGIVGGPYTNVVAGQKLNQINNSPLKFNIKNEKDAEKTSKNLQSLMMKKINSDPNLRKKYMEQMRSLNN